MDPNEALRRLRRAMIRLSNDLDDVHAIGDCPLHPVFVSGIEVVDLFQALDNWLASGGSQPNWDRAKTGGGTVKIDDVMTQALAIVVTEQEVKSLRASLMSLTAWCCNPGSCGTCRPSKELLMTLENLE